VIRAFMASAGRVIVLADATRWDTIGVATIAPLDRADTVIVDDALPPAARRILSARTGGLVTVGSPPPGPQS